MRATLSSTASGWIGYSGQFAALRHITRQMSLRNTSADTSQDVRERAAAQSQQVSMPVPQPKNHSRFQPIPIIRTVDVAEGAGLAHDAGNLLGALSLYSDLLAMPGVLHEEHRDYATELRMLSDRSWAMIDRLVNHASCGKRTKAAAAEMTILPHIADRCKGLLRRVAGREVEIECSVGAFEPVHVPAEAVERILTNLVKNAAEATPWVGAITILVEGSEELSDDGSVSRRVMLTVRDRGCGMDAAAIRGLMQGAGITSKKGRGLGFRVVRELVALSGGCLSIESQPEVGTSVSAEWYAVKSFEESDQPVELSTSMTRQEIRTLWKEEAGWIAC